MQGYVNDDLRADGPWKGSRFWVSSWNVDSLTGRAGEAVQALLEKKLMWHAFKKHDGMVVVASSKELKAKDISCSGW